MAKPTLPKIPLPLYERDATLHTPLGDQLNLSFLLFTPPQIRRGGDFKRRMHCNPTSPPLLTQLRPSSKERVNTFSRGKDVAFFPEPRHALPCCLFLLPLEGELCYWEMRVKATQAKPCSSEMLRLREKGANLCFWVSVSLM